VLSELAPEVEKVRERDRPKRVPSAVAVAIAAAYLDTGKLTEAEAQHELLSKWPGALTSSEAGEFRRKLRMAQLEKAMRDAPESARTWADYGRALIDQGQWEEAVVKLQTALEKDPSSPAVRRDLQYALMHLQERPAETDADLEAALAAAEKQVGLGKGETRSKDFYDWHTYAMLLYRKAYLQRQAGDPGEAATLARSREMMVEAIKCGRAGADVRQTSDTRSINIEGFAYPEAANDFMILDCLDILADHPEDYLARYTVATALLDMNQTEVAAEALAQCLKLRPDFLEGKYAGARLALQQGDREHCKELLGELLTANPRHPHANRMLAQLYMEEGDMVSSAACLATHAELYGEVE
jgi:predicted Zn-dependent protease